MSTNSAVPSSGASAVPHRLYLMQVATIPGANVPIVCYLVQLSDGTNVLIDTGLAPNTPPPPGMPAPIMHKNVIEQLAMLGLRPDDIHTLICTHFDADHAGNHEFFPNAEFVVQRSHYDFALTSPRFDRSRDHWNRPALRYCFVEGDVELFSGVTLFETSGHTKGHQSVLVRLPETGAVLLAIDAVTQQSRFTPDIQATPMDEDQDALQISARKLLAIAKKEDAALVVFGHDGDQWETLKKLPDSYC